MWFQIDGLGDVCISVLLLLGSNRNSGMQESEKQLKVNTLLKVFANLWENV